MTVMLYFRTRSRIGIRNSKNFLVAFTVMHTLVLFQQFLGLPKYERKKTRSSYVKEVIGKKIGLIPVIQNPLKLNNKEQSRSC